MVRQFEVAECVAPTMMTTLAVERTGSPTAVTVTDVAPAPAAVVPRARGGAGGGEPGGGGEVEGGGRVLQLRAPSMPASGRTASGSDEIEQGSAGGPGHSMKRGHQRPRPHGRAARTGPGA